MIVTSISKAQQRRLSEEQGCVTHHTDDPTIGPAPPPRQGRQPGDPENENRDGQDALGDLDPVDDPDLALDRHVTGYGEGHLEIGSSELGRVARGVG